MDIDAQYMDAPHRRVLDLRPRGLADVPMLGMYSYAHARPDLPVHRHAGGWEICYLERGNQAFEVHAAGVSAAWWGRFRDVSGRTAQHGRQSVGAGCVVLAQRTPAALGTRGCWPCRATRATHWSQSLSSLPHRHFRASQQTKTIVQGAVSLV